MKNQKVEFLYDYTCPYCYEEMEMVLSLLPDFPQAQIVWLPCEAHPAPEAAPIHSDKAAQAFYLAQAHQGDLPKFHMLVYRAHFEDGLRIDDLSVLADILAECTNLDRAQAMEALSADPYAEQIDENNRYVWDTLALPYVPSYRIGEAVFSGPHPDEASLREEIFEKTRL